VEKKERRDKPCLRQTAATPRRKDRSQDWPLQRKATRFPSFLTVGQKRALPNKGRRTSAAYTPCYNNSAGPRASSPALRQSAIEPKRVRCADRGSRRLMRIFPMVRQRQPWEVDTARSRQQNSCCRSGRGGGPRPWKRPSRLRRALWELHRENGRRL